MMTKVSIQSIKDYLKKEGYDCLVREDEKTSPFPVLLVHLGDDYKNREYLLLLTLKEQAFVREKSEGASSEDRFHYILEFRISLLFPVEDVGVADTARFLAFINKTIEIPGFELDEIEQTIFYRYAMLGCSDQLNGSLILATMGFMMMILDTFIPNIEEIASGKTTMNALMDTAIQQLSEIIGPSA